MMAFLCSECGEQAWRHGPGTFICKHGHLSRESALTDHPAMQPDPVPSGGPRVAVLVAVGELVVILVLAVVLIA